MEVRQVDRFLLSHSHTPRLKNTDARQTLNAAVAVLYVGILDARRENLRGLYARSVPLQETHAGATESLRQLPLRFFSHPHSNNRSFIQMQFFAVERRPWDLSEQLEACHRLPKRHQRQRRHLTISQIIPPASSDPNCRLERKNTAK